ncbi:uncharacterized protein BDV17DRAFT_294578 [Aspergillus undulatus]|uniref:uncharacterized protein n=1 Tax=Aspergillus undulatus TaxID=1810928 RepID=UPI003CCDD5C8
MLNDIHAQGFDRIRKLHLPPTRTGLLYDPVKKDNIMYSAYVQSMIAMFNSLFDDDRYQKPGALTFEYNAMLWGEADGWKFVYDQNLLNEQIYRNMVEEGYLGVPCETYCIYQVCNQIPIVGFRMNDVLTEDKNLAEEVTQGYVKAWEEKAGGVVTEHNIFNTFYMTHTRKKMIVAGGRGEVWTGFLMNAWNHKLVQETYNKRLDCLVHPRLDGTIGGVWGWSAVWSAEMGDDETRDRLLEYADKHFKPRLQNGGLMYPRNDAVHDSKLNFVMVSPLLSNALMPFTRLNYEEPALVEVDFNVDVYRAVYIADKRTLLFDFAVYEADRKGSVALGRVFGHGDWTLKCDGDEVARGSSHSLASGGVSNFIHRDAPKVPSRLGWGYSFQANPPSGIKKEGHLLRVPVYLKAMGARANLENRYDLAQPQSPPASSRSDPMKDTITLRLITRRRLPGTIGSSANNLFYTNTFTTTIVLIHYDRHYEMANFEGPDDPLAVSLVVHSEANIQIPTESARGPWITTLDILFLGESVVARPSIRVKLILDGQLATVLHNFVQLPHIAHVGYGATPGQVDLGNRLLA